ncbi:MAG: class II fructose-bisphosphate aldolase [Pseudomonadota bacterium]
MPMATLKQVLDPALHDGYAVAGLVVLGWEEARAYVHAGEAEGLPVILQAGPGCRKHTPLPILAAMFRSLGEGASVPVVAHLDHGYTSEECRAAIDCGFTSVMFDGSRKPLAQNVDETAAIAEMAHAAGVSLEGEVGFVGYDAGEASEGTTVEEAKLFAAGSGVDAMAISVGNVHLQQSQAAQIDRVRLTEIEAVTGDLPLVIHGGSGVPSEVRRELAAKSKVCKFNIGTELRMAFGSALREAVNSDPNRFDRVAILAETEAPVVEATRRVLREFDAPNW